MGKVLNFIFVVLLGFLSALAVSALIDYQGFGAIVVRLVPIAVIMVLMIMVKYNMVSSLFNLDFDKITSGKLVLIFIFSVISGVLVLNDYVGMTYMFIIMVIAGLWGLSLYCLVSDKESLSFVLLINTFPFIDVLVRSMGAEGVQGFIEGPFIITPINAVVVMYLLIYLSRKIMHRGNAAKSRHMFFYYAFMGFVACCFFSSILSADPITSFMGFIIEVIIFPIFYYIVKSSCKNKGDILVIFWGIIAYISIRLMLVFYMYFRIAGGLFLTHDFSPNLWIQIIQQKEIMTTLSSMVVPFCVVAYMSKNKLIKILFATMLVICFLLIFIGDKREPIISLFLTLPFVFLMNIKYKNIILSAMGLVLAVIIFYSIAYQTHISEILKLPDEIFSIRGMRVQAILSGVRMARTYPFFGIGFGMYATVLDSFADYQYYWSALWPLPSPHNFVLQYTSSIGVPGAVCLVSMIAWFFRCGIIFLKKNNDIQLRNICVAVLWALTVYFLSSNTGGTMLPFAYSKYTMESSVSYCFIDVGMILWVLYGMLESLFRYDINSVAVNDVGLVAKT